MAPDFEGPCLERTGISIDSLKSTVAAGRLLDRRCRGGIVTREFKEDFT